MSSLKARRRRRRAAGLAHGDAAAPIDGGPELDHPLDARPREPLSKEEIRKKREQDREHDELEAELAHHRADRLARGRALPVRIDRKDPAMNARARGARREVLRRHGVRLAELDAEQRIGPGECALYVLRSPEELVKRDRMRGFVER